MKIRCGSHQQNRSIVRPGLSLMATKVALTAEEFRENSQRSIDLFNTEKLSTNSTHVLKSAYCILCISAVAICTERVEAKVNVLFLKFLPLCCNLHGACGGKGFCGMVFALPIPLQSARSVWRQRRTIFSSRPYKAVAICTERVEAKLQRLAEHRRQRRCNLHGACGGKAVLAVDFYLLNRVAICTERVEAK